MARVVSIKFAYTWASAHREDSHCLTGVDQLALAIWLLPAASPDGRVNEACGDVNCF